MTKNQSSNARRRARKKALQQQRLEKSSEEEKIGNHNGKKRKRKGDDSEEEDDLLAFAAAWASNSNTHANNSKKATTVKTKTNAKHLDRKPPPFPTGNLALPPTDFLRNETPYQDAFQVALSTAYEGLVWEPQESTTTHERDYRHSLSVMDDLGLFRTDVTQPAGLGAKLVPSYVTRCLLGEEGTTYRYLGLRMFSHPWNGNHLNDNSGNDDDDMLQQNKKDRKALQAALRTFETLNQRLTQRTKTYLQTLAQQRKARNEIEPVISPNNKSSTFNVTLINKMTPHKRLREEPMFGTHKYSVGWHADSSLEHFSTIAVYHTIMTKDDNNDASGQDNNVKYNNQSHHKTKKHKKTSPWQHHSINSTGNDWAVALRVTHDAEGPRAKRLGDITVEPNAPPIEVALPSGSTYFMLDDFNHHHQHAVLAPSKTTTHQRANNKSTTSIRYSSTHRLLRQGHKVQDILARCKTVCDKLIHHGPKRWRSEQLLLTELENEWLRQYFIQGLGNQRLTWSYWKQPIQELFQYWERLETRMLQVLTLLQKASQERCHQQSSSKQQPSNSVEGREALQILTQVQGDRKNALDAIYTPMANLLLERAKSRDLWLQREKDHVFKRLPADCRPIPFPVMYASPGCNKGKDDEFVMAYSPLQDGSSQFLTELASHVKAWGAAYEQRTKKSLPSKDLLR